MGKKKAEKEGTKYWRVDKNLDWRLQEDLTEKVTLM